MKGIPLKDKIIVAVGDTVEKSESGMIVDANKKPDRGVVVGKGDEVDPRVELGDTVVFNEYAGKDIKNEDGHFITMREAEVYYVIKKDQE
jgi:chaperonin GroES